MLFSKVSYCSGFNKYHISRQYLMVLISCDFFWRSFLNILNCHLLEVVKQMVHLRSMFDIHDFMWLFSKVFFWTVFNKYYISWPYFMGPILWDFFSKVRFKYLEAKYWTDWTIHTRIILMGPIHVTFFEVPL